MSRIFWTAEERQAITEEALRVQRAGKVKTFIGMIEAAQRVIPKGRRRDIDNLSKTPWLVAALKGAANAPEAPGIDDQEPAGTKVALASENAPKRPVYWTEAEKTAVAEKAAQLLVNLEANGSQDALLKAQKLVLPPDRQRPVSVVYLCKDWFPDALQEAKAKVQREHDQAVLAKAQAAAEAAAPAPAPAPAPAVPVATIEPAPTPIAALAPSPTAHPIASIFNSSMWANLRAQLINEIAGIVSEGVLRGLESVKLGGAQTAQPESQHVPEEAPGVHVPFVREARAPKPPSVLVVGLKGAQVPLIEADFRGKLDLRFWGVHESKDQLRSMVEKADTTVAFVDFVSHSHTDIIKARTKNWIESHGGMTTLRQHLAQLAGMQTNGTLHS